MKREESKKKRLIMDVPLKFHQEIRNWATYRNVTITQYVTEAVIEKMRKDIDFNK